MRKNESSIVKFSLDPNNPPALTPSQKAELAALRTKSDDDIDFSDMPELDEAFWKAATRPIPPGKTQITLRLDADVLKFFKTTGSRYQTRINAVLKAYVDGLQMAHK